MMASYYTRSKVPRTSELVTSECSDVEPSDAAPSAAATSPLPLSITVRPSAAAAGEFGSMSTEPAEPVSAPIHPLPAGGPSSLGGRGVLGPAGSPPVIQGSSTPKNLGKIQQEMREKLGAQFWGFTLLITPALSSTRKTLEADDENLPFRHMHFLPIFQASG